MFLYLEMLTGNKEQDLHILIEKYNEYGKYVLTPDYNVNYEILKKLDIKSLSRFSITNKNARDICSNVQFWKEKFKQDDIYIFTNILEKLNLNQILKMYILSKESKEDIKRLFIVNKIIDNNVILIRGRKSVLYNIFNNSGNRSYDRDTGVVKIDINGDNYTYTINNQTYGIEKEALILGLNYSQYAILNNMNYTITDKMEIPLLVDQNELKRIIDHRVKFYYDHIDELIKRNTIYNTIIFLEQNKNML